MQNNITECCPMCKYNVKTYYEACKAAIKECKEVECKVSLRGILNSQEAINKLLDEGYELYIEYERLDEYWNPKYLNPDSLDEMRKHIIHKVLGKFPGEPSIYQNTPGYRKEYLIIDLENKN